MISLLALPQDILFEICSRLGPKNILALRQTCRGLHAFTSDDYFWHNFNVDLPLDLPDVDIISLPGSVIHKSVVNALRLEHNWRKRGSKIRRLISILQTGEIVLQTRLLERKWIIVLSRAPDQTLHLSVWRLPLTSADNPRQEAILEVAGGVTFTVGLQDGGKNAIIASVFSGVNSNSENRCHGVYIYNLSLEEDETGILSDSKPLKFVGMIPTPEEGAAYFDVHISGHILVSSLATFPRLASGPSISYKLLVVNTQTNFKALIDPQLPEPFNSHIEFKVRLYPEFVILLGWKACQLYVCLRKLPSEAFSSTVRPVSTLSNLDFQKLDQWGATLMEYDIPAFDNMFDVYLSNESSSRHATFMTAVFFYSVSLSMNMRGKFLRFKFDASHLKENNHQKRMAVEGPCHGYALPYNSSQDIVCMGRTGNKAIWFERKWDTDDYQIRLMKASIPANGEPPIVEMLLPKHVALPFELHTVQCLYFDEATGRVCFGLHTGDVYIMEF
ncbi:hypothetical protein BDQ17DRAFT_1355147 [Cyathus striatus]|nr:hypothetical protein BDQ17DRAFT_1355147 [Cyathus striatus]